MSLTNQADSKTPVGCSVKTILEDTIMKMFKKLMAIALAGVMTLAILTGCANYKSMVEMMNDYSKRAGIDLTLKEDRELTKKANTLADKIEAEGKNLTEEKEDAILKEVLGDKYDENYVVASAKPVDGKNDFSNNYYTLVNAQNLVRQLNQQLADHEGKTVNKIGITIIHDAESDADYLFVIGQLEDKAK